MRPTLRLGRVARIPVGVHWGALLILALIAGGLAVGSLPGLFPGQGVIAYAVAGVVAAALFLGSLLAHELAHAVVARANGITVEGITLWLLGGVAQLGGEPRSPKADFAIAIVGPAMSVVLGAGFGAVAGALALGGVGGLVLAVPAYLAGANLLLAVFNLVPAAPLDGGRVLRAALWGWHGDQVRATVTAARAGRLFGIALIMVGLAQVVLFTRFSGLWLALIGWFLVHAATAEAAQATANQRLGGLRVADVMTPRPMTAHPGQTVDDFIDTVALHRMFSSYPLVDVDQRFSGLVTLNRLRAVPSEQRATTRLADIACPGEQVPTATAQSALTDLLPRMVGCADGRAVVTDPEGRPVGVVSPSDISNAIMLADIRGPGSRPPRDADLGGTPARTG